MRSLPLAQPFDIDQLRIATPCDQDWSKMRGDTRTRFCDACSMSVYNVEALTRDEVRELVGLRDSGERVCLHLFRRRDGTVVTADCPRGLAEEAWRRARNATLTGAASLLTVVLFALTALIALRSEVTPAVQQATSAEQALLRAQQQVTATRDEVVRARHLEIDGGI